MAKKYLDDNGLLYLWGKIKEKFALKTHTHTKSEITDFPTSITPTSHTHGNIQNGGTLQSTDITIANGDKIVITDSSNSNKVARASLSFDGTTTTKALTPKGTFETFLTSADVPEGASASTTTPKMDGTAAIGTETGFARGDHVHPSDTSRVPTTRKVNGKALSSDVTIELSDLNSNIAVLDPTHSGTDYVKITDATESEESGTGFSYNVALDSAVIKGVQMNSTDLTKDSNGKVDIPVFTGATSSANGTVGLVPAPASSSTTSASYLSADGGFHKLVLSKSTSKTKQSVTLHKDTNTTANLIASVELAVASTTAAGIITADDKTKLNSITMTNGIIDSSCLPSFVDDVIEAYARANQTELGSAWLATESATGTVITPEAGKIYVLMNSSTNYEQNTQFRWGGTAYVQLNDSGCTSITNAEIDTIVAQ